METQERLKLTLQQIQPILTEKLSAFKKTVEDVKAGDFVVWKDGLKNQPYPKAGEPAIVLAKITAIAGKDVATFGQYGFASNLDVELGYLDHTGNFQTGYYDMRRFTKNIPPPIVEE